MSDFNFASVDNVLQAINALYSESNNATREEASKWLVEFQKSVYAWEVSDKLLSLGKDMNTTYFGASTLRNKVQAQFSELPATAHLSLKDSLLKHVLAMSDATPLPISNQILLAISDLYVLVVVWQDGIAELINTLSDTDVHLRSLLTILKYIPEEMKNRILHLGANRKNQLFAEMDRKRSAIIQLLSQKVTQSDERTACKIFECLSSWWDNTEVMTEGDINGSPLLEAAFCVLRNPTGTCDQLYEAVTQWILALLYQCKMNSGGSGALLLALQTNIVGLKEIVDQCGARSAELQPPQISVLSERLSSLAQIFGALARSLKQSLIFNASVQTDRLGDLRVMDCLLSVMDLGAPLGSRPLISHLFNSLHSLALSAGKHRFSTSRNADTSVELLIPYFTRAVISLTRFCATDSASLEEAEELRNFRDDVYWLMQDIAGLIGAEAIFVELLSHVQRLQAMSASPNNLAHILTDSEACLFMLSTVAKGLSPHDPDGHIANLMQSLVLPGLEQSPPPHVQEVACLLCMDLNKWAAHHPPQRKVMVHQLMKVFAAAVEVAPSDLKPGQRDAVSASLEATSKILSENRASVAGDNSPTLLDDHWEDLINQVVYKLPSLSWAPSKAIIQLFEGAAVSLVNSIGCQTPDSDPTNARIVFGSRLNQLLSVCLRCLGSLMDNDTPVDKPNVLSDPALWLHYISSTWRKLEGLLDRLLASKYSEADRSVPVDEKRLRDAGTYCLEECLLCVKTFVWPVVSRAMMHYRGKTRVIEYACRCLRFMIRSLSVNMKELLPNIAETIVSVNQQSLHGCFLYLSGVIVHEFGGLSDCREGLFNVFDALAAPALRLLEGHGLEQNPDVVEDLYRLTVRLTQKCATQFLSRGQTDVNLLLDVATRSISLYARASYDEDGDGDNEDELIEASAMFQATDFIIRVLRFTSEHSSEQLDEVFNVKSLCELKQLSYPTEIASRRVLIWLTKSTRITMDGREIAAPDNLSGGEMVLRSCLSSICYCTNDDSIYDLACIVFHLKQITSHRIFALWFDPAVSALPLKRSDGHENATNSQVQQFHSMIVNSSNTSEVEKALHSFGRLFT